MDVLQPTMNNFGAIIFVYHQQLKVAHKVYNRLKAILAEEQKSNKDLAAMLRVHSQTVSRWCTNSRQPSIEDLYAIAKALKRDVRDFLVPNK